VFFACVFAMSPSPRFRLSLLSGLLCLLALVLLGVCVWALQRGFDITDEGFYLLSYTYPVEYVSSFSAFNLLAAKVLPASSVSIVGYRVASLVCALLGATLFSWAFRRWSAARLGTQLPWAWVLPLFVIGSVVQYSVLPRTLYYNNLNSLAIAILASSVLYYLAAPTSRLALVLLVAGGMAIGLDAFVKLSSAGAAMGSAGLVLLLVPAGPGRRWATVRALGTLGVGFLLGVAVFGLFVKPLPTWFADMRHETTILLSGPYNAGLLVRYLTDAYPIIRTLLYPFGVTALIAGLWLYYQGRGINHLWQHLAVLAAIGLLLLFESYRTGLYRNTHLNHNRSADWPLGALLVGVVLLVVARRRYAGHSPAHAGWQAWVVPLWLLALPLASSLGTWNQIFINVLLELMYWLALLLILFQLLPTPAQLIPGVRLAFLAAPALVLAEQTVYGIGWGPYLQAENMWQQQVPITVGRPPQTASLLVDAPTAQYVGELRTALQTAGFHPGDPVLALYDAPGLVYALGGIAPGNAWYFGQQDYRNCDALDKTHLDIHRAFMLVNEPPSPDFIACLADHGMHFPVDYQLVHQAISPYSRNQYQWRGYQDTMRVYAPRPRPTATAAASLPR
jgi:hypothetical protein